MSQLEFDLPSEMPADAYRFGERTSGETHGVVLTKPHIVELILDLAHYVPERDLGSLTFLEPACGHGAFLLPAVRRLLDSAQQFGRDLTSLASAITAYDIDEDHIQRSRKAVSKLLRDSGFDARKARDLARKWIVHADFLLSKQPRQFDVIVGNPPYIRVEHLDPILQNAYRIRFDSLFDRADLYVAFIERALHLLADSGRLSFICADRWILNKYGAPLRRLISEKFRINCYIDLHQASPFDSDVIAYPAIFSISPGQSSDVRVGFMKSASPDECDSIRKAIQDPSDDEEESPVHIYSTWFKDNEPWVITSPEHLNALRDLETRFDPLQSETTKTKVGIGVATGCDGVYIVGEGADIEQDRLVPLVMRGDIDEGKITNCHRYVINTFVDGGGIIDLDDFPRLRRYLENHLDAVKSRHVSKKNSRSWFRTIDRVYPDLVRKPKLLIPDIAGSNEVAFEKGLYHPHHNLYFVTSEKWDLEVLGGLLSSRVALFFVWSYAVKMRGGYLRFQAQYLRRIRVPRPESIPEKLSESIAAAFRKRDFSRLDKLALRAYRLKELPPFDFVDTRK